MSDARIFAVSNPLADAVDVRFGLEVSSALGRAGAAMEAAKPGIMKAIDASIEEIADLCGAEAPPVERIFQLSNGVLGLAGAYGMEPLSRCAGLFCDAVDAMRGEGRWRADAVTIYVRTLRALSDRSEGAVLDTDILASLEVMNQRLAAAASAG